MNPDSFTPAAPPTIEQGVNALVGDVKDKLTRTYDHCEQCVRKSPAQSLLLAVAGGYCLHRLPVRSILVTNVRLLAALAPPALLVFGAAKLCEFLQKQARTNSETARLHE